MEVLVSLSAKRLGDLYHYTSIDSFLAMLSSGTVTLSSGRAQNVEETFQGKYSFFLSLTRSRTGDYHVGKKDAIMLTFDGDKLSNKYKFASVDYWGGRAHKRRSEAEERLLSDQVELPILGYLKQVDLIHSSAGVRMVGFEPGPKDKTNVGYGLVKIESFLKRNKIPYEFYPDMKSWIIKRGQYTPIAPKSVGRKTRTRGSGSSYEILKGFLSILQDPVEKMDRKTKDRFVDIGAHARNWSDLTMLLMEYRDALYPSGVHAAIAQVGRKISGTMRHLGIKTDDQVYEFIKAKYETYENAKRETEFLTKGNACAKSIIRLLDASISDAELTPAEQRMIPDVIAMELKDCIGDLNFYLSKLPDLSKYSAQVKDLVVKYKTAYKSIPKVNALSIVRDVEAIRSK